MEAQRLLDAAPFPPDIVKVLKQALEGAWASIAPTIAPDRVDDTRMSLAHAVIAHAAVGDHDLKSLIASALDAVKNNRPSPQQSDS
jgi:hypothetical protein